MLNIVKYMVEFIYLHHSLWLEVYLLKSGWGRQRREIWWKYSPATQGRKHITALHADTPSFAKEQLSPQWQPRAQKHFAKAVPCCGNHEAHGNPLCTEMKPTNPDSRCEGGDLGADRRTSAHPASCISPRCSAFLQKFSPRQPPSVGKGKGSPTFFKGCCFLDSSTCLQRCVPIPL